jgi:hypothetical protein
LRRRFRRMIVAPERLLDSEVEYRTNHQVTVVDRGTGAPLTNGAYSLPLSHP